MVITTVILALLLAAALVDRHVAASRHAQAVTEARQFAAELAGQMGREHAAHRTEIQTLLQRIQAPQAAVIQHAQDNAETASEPVYPFDDIEQANAQDVATAARAILATIHEAETDLQAPLT